MTYIRDLFLSLEKIGYFVGPQNEETTAADVDAKPNQNATESIEDELKRLMPQWK